MNKKYENGDRGKITYWTRKLNKAIEASNLIGEDSAHRKIEDFIGRQWDLDNPQA